MTIPRLHDEITNAACEAEADNKRLLAANLDCIDHFEVQKDAEVNSKSIVPALVFGDGDHVLVPRSLLGAACSAIDKKRNCANTLAELRRYTTGDLSKAAPQPAACAADDGWQPIETAPKDGRVLWLGYYNAHGNWRTLRGEWVSADQIAECWEEEAEPGWYETAVEAEDPPSVWATSPTHWRPLPKPPTDKGAPDA